MPDDRNLLASDRSEAIAAISQLIYQTLVSIQKQHPHWLTQKYGETAWDKPKYRSALTEKLTKGLGQIKDREELLPKVKKYLQILLVPEFVNSPEYKTLIGKINRIISPKIAETNLINSLHFENSQNGIEPPVIGIAVLLLDVENLQIDLETEKLLEQICTYPIQIKVAFANWRSMGKKDIEFHNRGYQLIHVPAGKDSADLKMATVGASIFVHYPTAKEVLVCSSDRAMTHLGNTLQSHGLTVYQVRKKRHQIIVLNSQTGECKTHQLFSKIEMPSLEELIGQLQELIKGEIETTGMQWFEVSRISDLYDETYSFTLSEAVDFHFPGSPASDIFLNHPANFVLHQPGENEQTYVSLFYLEKSDNLGGESAYLTGKPSEIDSLEKIEPVLVKIINKLTNNSPNSYALVSHVATEFNQIYGQALTKTIKQLRGAGKLSKFLPLCSSLKVNEGNKSQLKVAVIKPKENG
jgi:hypothetical protein